MWLYQAHAFDAYLYRFHKLASLVANAIVKKDVVLVFLGELLHLFQETLLIYLLYFNILQRFLPHSILHCTSECRSRML